MQYVTRMLLLLLVSFWYGGTEMRFVLGLSFDQCHPDDSLFKYANIELEMNTNTTGWIKRIQVTNPQQCANRCHHMRPRCKSATINVESKTCLMFDINRYSLKAKFRNNASFSYFERYECPQQQQALPTVFPGVPGPPAINNDDIRYKKFVAVQRKAKNCKDLYSRFHYRTDGLYAVNVGGGDGGYLRPIKCDMTTRNGGWTVIERRMDGNLSFDTDWNDFKSGFGDFNGEFYYGNENWHLLTKDATIQHELYFILETASGSVTEHSYTNVSIGPERDRYRLALGVYQYISGVDLIQVGTDRFKLRNEGKQFSTRDRDATDKCVAKHTGGFWYGPACGNVNLHGTWGIDNTLNGIKWRGITGSGLVECIRKVTILIR